MAEISYQWAEDPLLLDGEMFGAIWLTWQGHVIKCLVATTESERDRVVKSNKYKAYVWASRILGTLVSDWITQNLSYVEELVPGQYEWLMIPVGSDLCNTIEFEMSRSV